MDVPSLHSKGDEGETDFDLKEQEKSEFSDSDNYFERDECPVDESDSGSDDPYDDSEGHWTVLM